MEIHSEVRPFSARVVLESAIFALGTVSFRGCCNWAQTLDKKLLDNNSSKIQRIMPKLLVIENIFIHVKYWYFKDPFVIKKALEPNPN